MTLATDILNRIKAAMTPDPGVNADEIHYSDLENGHTLVRLTTSAAVLKELEIMQQQDIHIELDKKGRLPRNGHSYLALRDSSNKSHALLEIRTEGRVRVVTEHEKIGELAKPQKDALAAFFMNSSGYECGHALDDHFNRGYAKILDFIIDEKGKWHPFDNLPDGLTTTGRMNLTDSNITHLPKNMTVNGNLDISDTLITSIPEGMHVKGTLRVLDTPLKEISNGVRIDGDLEFLGNPIESLPDDLEIGGDLGLYDVKITEIPSTMSDDQQIRLKGITMTVAEFRRENTLSPGM